MTVLQDYCGNNLDSFSGELMGGRNPQLRVVIVCHWLCQCLLFILAA